MSKSVDERVVEMQFDNKQFESGIKQSLKSLENLRKGLNFDKATKSLANIEKATKNFSVAGLEKSVDLISSKFTNLGIVGVTALQRITNAAITAGSNLVKSLTLDPVLTGFQEYETKMGAITTILTNTASKGTTLEDVNKALNELNEYADQTIYNFAEMTKNIGTFTAAGVDLETSVEAIKGISNLAAGSGSTPQQAATAMYQLSQALAAGRVSLQDWNSVVNAGMGGELFQNALKETAKQMGIVVDESVSFRESISAAGGGESWLTSDVLIKTLQKFANDESLTKAATQVKTFTQLIDTMKESVQSGWAQSWEYIIGDSEQAAELFTNLSNGFNSLIQPSTDARNSALQFWNANGGREAVIQGLTNVLESLGNILGPIGEAFNQAFPAITGERLVDISNKFLKLTENFKVGERTSENLRKTFGGLFSVLKLVGKGISAVVKPLFGLTDSAGSAIDTILSVTGAFGEFLTKVSESKSVGDALSTISNSIEKEVSGINNFLKTAFSGTENIKTFISKFVNDAAGILESVTSKISSVIEWISEHVSIGDVFAGLAGGGIFIAAKKLSGLFETIGDAIENLFGEGGEGRASKISEQFSELLSSVHDSIASFSSGIKISSLLTIATSIGILTMSLNQISKIKSTSVAKSLGAIGVMMAELNLSFRSINKTMSKFDAKGIIKAGVSLITISISIKILSSAMEQLSKIDAVGLAKGLGSIGGLLTELAVFLKLTDLKSSSLKGATSLIIIAGAVTILADAMTQFAGYSWEEVGKGLATLGGSLAELAIAIRIISKSKISVRTGMAILILAESCKILADALSKFGSMKWGEIARGLSAMGGALAELTIVTSVLGKFGGLGSLLGGGAIYIITQSLSQISNSLKEFGSMDWGTIGRGLTAMGGALVELSTSVGLLGKLTGFSGILGSTSILIAVQALEPISESLERTSALSWEQIGKGLAAMGTSFAEIAIIVGVLGKLTGISGLLGGGAILLAVQSLEPIGESLNTLGSMSWGEIGRGLTAMGGALTEISIIIGALGELTGLSGLLGGGAILLGVQGLGDLAEAMQSFSSMSWEEIGRALTAMGGAMVELGVVAGLLGTLAPLSVLGSGSILIGVQGLGELADSLKKFGSMDWDEIGKGLTAMAGTLGASALGGLLNTLSFLGAAAISEMAPALGTLADSLSKWKNVTVPEGLAGQLASLADGVMKFTFGGLGASTLSTAAPGVGELADAVKKWSNVSIPDGLEQGLTGIANGVKAFSWAFVGGWSLNALVSPLGDLASTITKWSGVTIPEGLEQGLTGLADGVKAFSFAFIGGWSLGEIIEPLKNLADSVRNWNGVTIPEGLGSGLKSLAEGINSFDTGWFGTDLGQVGTGLKQIASAVKTMDGVNISGIGSGLSEFADSIAKIPSQMDGTTSNIKSALDGLSSAITNKSETISNSFSTLMSKGIQVINSKSAALSLAGKNIINKFSSAINSSLSNETSKMTNSLNRSITNMLNSALTRFSSYNAKFQNAGRALIDQIVKGINTRKTTIGTAINAAISSATKRLGVYTRSFYTAGQNMAQGLANGLRSGRSSVINAASSTAADALSAAKRKLGIHSPSKEFEWIGEQSDNGLIRGLLALAGKVKNTGENVGDAALSGVGLMLRQLPRILDSDINFSPRIQPVLDLSNLTAGAAAMNSMFPSSYGIHTNIDTADIGRVSNRLSSRQNGTTKRDYGPQMLDAMNRMSSQINTLGDRIEQMQIVLDTGATVGALSPKIDQKLGQTAKYKRRNI